MTAKIKKMQGRKTYRVIDTVYANTPRDGYTLSQAQKIKKIDDQLVKLRDRIDIIFWEAYK